MWPPLNSFPTQPSPETPGLFSMTHEGAFALSVAHAIEGGAFVLFTTAVLTEKNIDAVGTRNGVVFNVEGGGHAAVIAPDGRTLTEPLEGGQAGEGVLFADLALETALGVRGFMDVVGHYSRPELLWLGVDRQEKKCVVEKGETPR